MFAVVQNGYAIFGVGNTRAEAIADAREWVDDPETLTNLPRRSNVSGEFYIASCTPALAAAVRSSGGDISFTERRDGTVCLPDEA